MKSMNNNNSCWLGFSLSPQMSMEVSSATDPHHNHNHNQTNDHTHFHHQQQQSQQPTVAAVSSAVSSSGYYLSAPASNHFSSSGFCFGVGESNGGGPFYSQLASMPLKSDGSLCIMEALTRSQQEMVPTSSPKLEDFLGCGPNMGTQHQYGSNDRGGSAMALSLDSMYYHQTTVPGATRSHHPLGLLQHQTQYFQPLHEDMCSVLSGHGLYEEVPLQGEPMAHEDIPKAREWVSRTYIDGSNAMGTGPIDSLKYGGELQTLSLSMSPGSQSSCVTAAQHVPNANTASDYMALDVTKKRGSGKLGQKQTVHRKSIETFGQRTSQYRGVTRHRWTGRYEAHLWDNSCKKEGQTRKGRQVYLGGYDTEEKAARAYDLAALKYWGSATHINFPLEDYQQELEDMKKMTRQEHVAHLRRRSSGFSRGASIYRGVTRHHQHGRWQARIGRVSGNKDLYLGTFSTQEEAAEAYDVAAIKFRGLNAVTNFDISRYDVEKIMASNTLLAGELARRNKEAEPQPGALVAQNNNAELNLTEENSSQGSDWKMTLHQTPSQSSPIFEDRCQALLADNAEFRHEQFSTDFHGFFGIHPESSMQVLDDTGNLHTAHMSNASSLVSSLSNSREGSPDKANNLSIFFNKPEGPKYVAPTPLNSWIPASQLTSSLPVAQTPLFAAWSDALKACHAHLE